MDTLERIKQQIADNAVILYMKGSPEMPQCGFSARAAQALMACGVEFAYINILENPDIREMLPQYAQWPTFPQLYIGGELIGGSDIIQDLYTKGELQTMLEKVSSV